MTDPQTTALTGQERQFLIEASGKHGRVAGHNNAMAMRFERDGFVMAISHGLQGQSNYHITDIGILALEEVAT